MKIRLPFTQVYLMITSRDLFTIQIPACYSLFLYFPQPFATLVAFFTSLKEAAPFSTASATSPFVT